MCDWLFWTVPKKRKSCRFCVYHRWGRCTDTLMCPRLRVACERQSKRNVHQVCVDMPAASLHDSIVLLCLKRRPK